MSVLGKLLGRQRIPADGADCLDDVMRRRMGAKNHDRHVLGGRLLRGRVAADRGVGCELAVRTSHIALVGISPRLLLFGHPPGIRKSCSGRRVIGVSRSNPHFSQDDQRRVEIEGESSFPGVQDFRKSYKLRPARIEMMRLPLDHLIRSATILVAFLMAARTVEIPQNPKPEFVALPSSDEIGA